jgi:hypothetical protein
LAFIITSILSYTQVYQLTWSDGEVLFGISLDDLDSVSYVFSDNIDMSQVHIVNRNNINKRVHDTVYITKYIHDTIYITKNIQSTNYSAPSSAKSIGVFSVGSNKKVTFSPGNLQYQPSTDTWRFAPNQKECVSKDYADIGSNYSVWIDEFSWGTGSNPTKTSKDDSDYSTFVDWGCNKIGNDAPNTWRTLTREEQAYLLESRKNAKSLYGIAQVCGVNGLILLPDNWMCLTGVTFKPGFHNVEGTMYYKAFQTFTSDEWNKLESSGAVFLPISTSNAGTYWASSEGYSYEHGVVLSFYSDRVGNSNMARHYSNPVRLVRDVR